MESIDITNVYASPFSTKGVIKPRLSPTSPNSVMVVPDMMTENLPTLPEDSPSSSNKVGSTTTSNYGGSKPYYGRFIITPPDEVMNPMIRTILDTSDSKTVATVYQSLLDEMFVQEMKFQKSDNIYSYTTQLGHRLVVAQMNREEFGIACAEKEVADKFLMLLLSKNFKVKQI